MEHMNKTGLVLVIIIYVLAALVLIRPSGAENSPVIATEK